MEQCDRAESLIATDSLRIIFSFCSLDQFTSILAVNSEWYDAARNDNIMWMKLYEVYLNKNISLLCSDKKVLLYRNSKLDRWRRKWTKCFGIDHEEIEKNRRKDYYWLQREIPLKRNIRMRKFLDYYLIIRNQFIGEYISEERQEFRKMLSESLNYFASSKSVSKNAFREKWNKLQEYFNDDGSIPESIRVHVGGRRINYLSTLANAIMARYITDMRRVRSSKLSLICFEEIISGKFFNGLVFEPFQFFNYFYYQVRTSCFLESGLEQRLVGKSTNMLQWTKIESSISAIPFIVKYYKDFVKIGLKIIQNSNISKENKDYLLEDPARVIGHILLRRSNFNYSYSQQVLCLNEYRIYNGDYFYKIMSNDNLNYSQTLDCIKIYEKIHNKRIITARDLAKCVNIKTKFTTILEHYHEDESDDIPLIFLLTKEVFYEPAYCLQTFETTFKKTSKCFMEDIKLPMQNPLLYIMKIFTGSFRFHYDRWAQLIANLAKNSNLDFVDEEGCSFYSILSNESFPEQLRNMIQDAINSQLD